MAVALRHLMQSFARWHIWLGWLVGFPILMWTATGLFMAARPIEEVRGEHLRTEEAPIATDGVVFPQDAGNIREAHLVQQYGGAIWVITEAEGGRYRYSAKDGSLLPPVTRDEATDIAHDAYAGKAELEALTYFPDDLAPRELGQKVAVWQAHFADGTNLYLLSATGEVLAVRTGWWRAYDLMWGLHIMDLKTRDDTSHPILILFAALAVIGSLLGCTLMFRRRKSRPRP